MRSRGLVRRHLTIFYNHASCRRDYHKQSFVFFFNSAREDFSVDSLLQTLDAFYSHESIKDAKANLADLLRKESVMRRNPEKKMKDLRDVIDFYDEVKATKMKVNFLCNTYKGMPPVGFEFIAPMISNLSDEIVKINDVLPKILDIKSQVVNTADTVRQLRNDVIDVKNNFSKAVSGIEEATNDICDDDLAVLNDVRSFRMSFGNASSLAAGKTFRMDEVSDVDRSYALALQVSPKDRSKRNEDDSHVGV